MAADWASQHKDRVICSEFGAFGETIPPYERAVWVKDVRLALEAYGIGWAMWEYDGDFNLVTRQQTQTGISIVPVSRLLKALGFETQ